MRTVVQQQVDDSSREAVKEKEYKKSKEVMHKEK